MKRTRTTAAALALTAVAAIGGGQALAAGDGPKDFKAIAKVVSAHPHGDTAVFKEKLKVGGKKAGKAKVKLTFKDDGDVKLNGTWRFDHGTIKAKGKLEGKKPEGQDRPRDRRLQGRRGHGHDRERLREAQPGELQLQVGSAPGGRLGRS